MRRRAGDRSRAEASVSYVAGGTEHRITLLPLRGLASAVRFTRAGAPAGPPHTDLPALVAAHVRHSATLSARFDVAAPEELLVVVPQAPADAAGHEVTIATSCVLVEGARADDLRWAAARFGASVVAEGGEGKLLLRVPGGGRTAALRTFEAARGLAGRGVGAAHPNFLRARRRSTAVDDVGPPAPWAHVRIGVRDAWRATRGRPQVRVAILDDGVDAHHPALRAAIVAERDFIGPGGTDATPAAGDAHGTACAGVVASRDARYPGVAPGSALVAARIAVGSPGGLWITDDFATADAIDWCWRSRADVLSSSWCGGPPVDGIARAFERAWTRGRRGRGSVVVVAAGNDEGPVAFPATLAGAIAVGASNQFDERKTRRSRDREPGWGSNGGHALALLAPGVAIATTAPGRAFTTRFNGTSAAAAHVAAATALILSVAPRLTAAEVRTVLTATARPIANQAGWTPELGHGRLDVAAAVRAAGAGSPGACGGAGRRRRAAPPRAAARRSPGRARR